MNTPFTRKTGSQSEIPSLKNNQNHLNVSGYHGYQIYRDKISITRKESEIKFLLLNSYLSVLPNESEVIDIGCSAGAIGLQIVLTGRNNITFLDHDVEYTELVSKVLKFIGRETNNKVITSTLSNYEAKHDVGIALALIHWLYSYTESYGSLSEVIGKLKQNAEDVLIVEWISEKDPAIMSAGHIYKNSGLHKSPYNYKEFKKALKEHYSHSFAIGKVNSYREIWIASVNPITPNTEINTFDRRRIMVIKSHIIAQKVLARLKRPFYSLLNLSK